MLNNIVAGCCAKWSRNQKMVNYFLHTKVCSDRKQFDSFPDLGFRSRYNRQTIEQVLDILNGNSENDLTRYNISKKRLHNVEKYRKKNGPFECIEELLQVDDFGGKILEKLIASIVAGPQEPKKETNKTPTLMRSLVSPILDNRTKSSIDTVTSIHVSAKEISWAHMETNGRLLSWNSYDSFEWPKKDDTMQLHDLALKVRNNLPNSDAYVTEEVDTQMHNPGNTLPYTIFTNIQRLQLTTMLVTLIATKFDQSNENGSDWTQMNNCYLLRRGITAQLFRLVVGSERVSPNIYINQIMNKNVAEPFQHILPVTIDISGIEMYEKSWPLKKEALSQALLFSIAFVDMVLNSNSISLNSLTLRKKSGVYE